MTTNSNPKGWIGRQISDMTRESATWPEWMQPKQPMLKVNIEVQDLLAKLHALEDERDELKAQLKAETDRRELAWRANYFLVKLSFDLGVQAERQALDEALTISFLSLDGSPEERLARLVTAEVTEKVKAERERCAKVARKYVDWAASIAVYAVAEGIAEEIEKEPNA